METLTFRSSAPLSDFQAVYVDDVFVDRSYYELASGSTIVRLRKEFLDSLAEGIHTLEIRSTGGIATANLQNREVVQVVVEQLVVQEMELLQALAVQQALPQHQHHPPQPQALQMSSQTVERRLHQIPIIRQHRKQQ